MYIYYVKLKNAIYGKNKMKLLKFVAFKVCLRFNVIKIKIKVVYIEKSFFTVP